METSPRHDSRTVKAKKGGAPAATNPGYAAPRTFFLKSEKELEKSVEQRGRRNSHSTETSEEPTQKTPMESVMEDSSFGVQSLEETINSTFSLDSNLSRTASNSTDSVSETSIDDNGLGPVTGRKRKAGNRVHPTIMATGQRIISSERPPWQASSGASPASAFESPLQHARLRRGSASSSTNVSQPLTPIKLSPHPESAFTNTPRSASPKSFRLSDEDSMTDDNSSQAVMSSSGDDEDQVERTPQLVMPSLAMPARRPFTERGRQIGRSKIMILGSRGIGKTSLISSICRRSEDIVHVDQPAASLTSHSSPNSGTSAYHSTLMLTEITASTRPYPSWWTGPESVRSSQRRRGSVGEGVLERNITFMDTPGLDSDELVQNMLNTVNINIHRTTTFDPISNDELIEMLGGSGGVQIDAVLYLFDPGMCHSANPAAFGLSPLHQEFLRTLCRYTNFIPLIGRSDCVSAEMLVARKKEVISMLNVLNIELYSTFDISEDGKDFPLAISSATKDDGDEVDASVLMSSQYVQPLVPSELDVLVDRLLAPANIARMKHLSAVKYAQWRHEGSKDRLGLHKTLLQSPFPRSVSPGVTSTGSLLEDPSKVLVPHPQSSYHRSTSPANSDISAQSGNAVENSAIARYDEQAQPPEPFRRIRLAKWAQDLQRSLDNERRKYPQMYSNRPSGWTSEDSEKFDNQALVSTKDGTRPARGRLGGDLGVIDPTDPLGVLAFGQIFRRRSVFVLQIVGGCGLIGAVAYWVVKNWVDVQEFFGFGQTQGGMVTATAVPAPVQMNGWLDENPLKHFFGWSGR
ncbi:hypothetical protein DOTSEDRAFT_67494 [Lecanosticta acicola]|uniref:Septin-type G domain-containing protein n=1 Tax=Lecanosticta acicola TaxID=111012 RepID=A0AAI8Z015_9PEZI|nr:hypothetical protein DOTSEDRAFT_67494 [Lecanosticta acicola]